MKKNLVRLFAAAMGAACVFSFAACGGNSSSKAQSSASSTVVSSEASVSSAVPASSTAEDVSSAAQDVSSTAGTEGLITIEDFVNSDIMQKELSTMKESMAEDGMDIDVTANGNQLVYTFDYGDLGDDMDADVMSAALEGAMDSMASTFEEVADQLQEAVGSEDVSVLVEFVAGSEELYSKEFYPTGE